jgi:hypothetical protein
MAGGAGLRLDTLGARRVLGGLSVAELARRSNLTDEKIQRLENGDTCRPEDLARILSALASPVPLASNTQASPTVFTVTAGHDFQTGDSVTIAGVTGANADPNGTRVVTRVNGTTFSVPVNCGTAGGTGGTATLLAASITAVGL